RLKMVESIEDALLSSVMVCCLVTSRAVIHRSRRLPEGKQPRSAPNKRINALWTLQLPPYRMFAVVCILLRMVTVVGHYSGFSMFYASNISAPAEAPPQQNLCHGLASSAMVFNYDQRR
ncbi:hypothetical protein, partial [Rothia sp. HMSC066G07]